MLTLKTELVWNATQYTQIELGSFDGMWGRIKWIKKYLSRFDSMVLCLSLMSLWGDPSIKSWAWEYLCSLWFCGGSFNPFTWN